LADREGRLEGDLLALKLRILPADNCDIGKLLHELMAAGLVRAYAGDDRALLYLPGFIKRQKPHKREAASCLPAPSQLIEIQEAAKLPGLSGLGQPSGPSMSASPRVSVSVSKSVSKTVSVSKSVEKHAEKTNPPTPTEILGDWLSADDFWNWFQALRRKAGCVKEAPPSPRALSAFWSEALMELEGNPEPLREAVYRFGDEAYWQNAKPPCPWDAFAKQWRDFIPRGAVAHDA
jgi:hypothetical protein